MSPATLIGSLLGFFLFLLAIAIILSLFEPASKPAKLKSQPHQIKPRQKSRPVPITLSHTERHAMITATKNMVVSQPLATARLVRQLLAVDYE